jgi:hypothetical protein
MLVSKMVSATSYPHVQGFIADVLDMQFGDVRAMLQLPRPEVGIHPACNFAITSTLCNLISGISTTIFMPVALIGQFQGAKVKYQSGPAFKELLNGYFPYTPSGTADFAKELYGYCRNPLAHAVGVSDAVTPIVALTRVFDPSHPKVGWSDKELTDLELMDGRFAIPHPSIAVGGGRWTLHCDALYFDVIKVLKKLAADPIQMAAAEGRFTQGVFNWRLP